MKIEFGCGETPTKPGFLTCDIRDLPGIDFVCVAWDIDRHVGEDSVEEIFSRHFFEHLTFQQGQRLMGTWYRILQIGGVCEIMVPNMDYHIQQWLNPKNNKDFAHACAGFWGWQRGTFDDTWDIHKSGYNYDSLARLMAVTGFREIRRLDDGQGIHLHVTALK